MFLRQHFGKLAIGLSNADQILKERLDRLQEEDNKWERERFFSVSDGGVSHPWSHKQDEIRVAITGDRLVFYPERLNSPGPRVFAKVEFQMTGEVYLAYNRPHSTISYGLPDPNCMAEEIVKTAANYVNKGKKNPSESCWVVVDKPQVPKYHRSLLGKVMVRVQSAINQGSDFFKDPMSR